MYNVNDNTDMLLELLYKYIFLHVLQIGLIPIFPCKLLSYSPTILPPVQLFSPIFSPLLNPGGNIILFLPRWL